MEGINYNGCKVATFLCNLNECENIEGYEKAANNFLAKHNIINVIPTVSNNLLVVNIFYKDSEVKNG